MARPAAAQAEWALLGASVRLAQIDAERASILKSFPDLRRGVPADITTVRPKRAVSAKARRAMSEGMRKFWLRRKAAAKK